MEQIYQNTDLLLIPSVYETGSFTCIESFSYGIPVIARNVYGLKKLIKNKITGYLFNSDTEILNKLKKLKKTDSIFKNTEIIKKESLQYNIIDKIKDFENIININLKERNIIIITSVINCLDNELSYYYRRTVFNIKERYEQTLESIKSIKKYIPNIEILFCECSDLSEYMNIEENIKKEVDYFFNFYSNDVVKKYVNGKLKGLGEAHILLKGIEELLKIKKKYKNIFKLSGRYYLNHNFNYSSFDNSKNIFTNWDNYFNSYCTIFYKINGNDIYYFKEAILNSFEDLHNEESIEKCIFKYFTKNICLVQKINISGFLSTEGYLFNI
jgi:hypothetical protein